MRKIAPSLFLALVILALDQGTKFWVQENIAYGSGFPVIDGFFNMVFVLNKGAAFGFLNDASIDWQTTFFTAISVVACVVIAFLLYQDKGKTPFMSTGLSLVLGGALGNMVDRLRIGYVIDFFDFQLGTYHWPAFNVADSAICIGVFTLMASMYMSDKRRGKAKASGNSKER